MTRVNKSSIELIITRYASEPVTEDMVDELRRLIADYLDMHEDGVELLDFDDEIVQH